MTLWRARDLAPVGELRGPVAGIQSLAWSHDGRLVAATGNEGDTTVIWDVRTGKVVERLGPAGPGGTDGVNFSADDRLLGTAGADGTLHVYDVRTGTHIATLTATPGIALQALDFSSDRRRVAAAGLAGTIWVWDVGGACGRSSGRSTTGRRSTRSASRRTESRS